MKQILSDLANGPSKLVSVAYTLKRKSTQFG